jgi:glutamyl-tRNA synthetase
VLRIEDTDEARNRPEWTAGIIDALAWIGIVDTDPAFEGPYYQSAFGAVQVAAAERLFAGGRAYYCDMTPEEVQQRARAEGRPGYGGWSRDRGLGPGPGHVLRFRVPDDGTTVVRDLIRGDVTFEHESIEDFVLLRGNGTPMFLLANVVDDVEMAITHVVRAEEHLPNTPKQQLLWTALGHQPPIWAHVPVLVNEGRKKLSKRRDKVALEQYRAEGYLADAMVNYLMTLGWAPKGETEIVSWGEIEEQFRLEDVTHSPAYFDLKKLAAFNGEYIRALPAEDFLAAVEPFLPGHYDRATFAAIAPLVQTRVVTLAEAPALVDFLFAEPEVDEASWAKAMKVEWAGPILDDVIAAYGSGALDWEAEALHAAFDEIAARRQLKPGKAGGPLRVAVTGRGVGPPMYESLELLGRAATLARLRAARDRVAAAPSGPPSAGGA